MGEARVKRRSYGTLDGGPPSDDTVMMQIEVFSPWDLIDHVRLGSARGVIERLEQSI